MINSVALLKDLKAQLHLVKADLRAFAEDANDRWGARLQGEYAEARRRERTGHSWVVWRDNEVDQAAVAWLIATTFIRFCEDNDLLSGARLEGQPVPVGWIAGPDDRTTRAEENLTAYFRENPTHNRRDWLRQAFRVLAAQPAGKALVDERHNPVWSADISAERASSLIDFWRITDSAGELVHDFTDPDLDTRFLGDLYQDLSDHARKTYALLQTPVFVEEFILDQTLTPALDEFGLEGIKLIDPTCGSGHFLLGAFERLVDQWASAAPAIDAKERVRRAMDSIHGVDLNPFAIAIARFRLTVAGLLAMGDRSLVGVPNLGFHLAIGDSLLGEFGGAPEALRFEGEEDETYFYDSEDLKKYVGILNPGQYHVVVGNPPYITPPDRALKALYRLSYSSAYGLYVLSVPFMELFFRLAIRGEAGQGSGHVGQITANSFMKREFGKKLIEEFLAGFHQSNPVDLTRVIDTSGAFIPGHGTPTVILIGRRRRPVHDQVRAVLGVRGEPSQPIDPARGHVWSEIIGHVDQPGFEGTYVSVEDLPRVALREHPWTLSGGAAPALMQSLESDVETRLGQRVERIGFMAMSHADEQFTRPSRAVRCGHLPADVFVPLASGEGVRDFKVSSDDVTWFPYEDAELRPSDLLMEQATVLWRFRTDLEYRALFKGTTYKSEGRAWYAWHQVPKDSAAHKWAIPFAFVATHNHFVLDRGGMVYKQSAPVIKLPKSATEDDHLALLGVLNSSTACFWLKQVSYPKGGDPVGDAGARVSASGWDDRYEYTGTKLEQFPLPRTLPLERARVLDGLARELSSTVPSVVIMAWLEERGLLAETLASARGRWEKLRSQMIWVQEELDWEVYRLYGLVESDLTYSQNDMDGLELGERAFEIALARQVEAGTETTTWFSRHGSSPILDAPSSWPKAYLELVEGRLSLIDENPSIRLLEVPNNKRRWLTISWDEQVAEALRSAVLDRLESADLWQDAQGPVVRSVAELADTLKGDAILLELVAVLTGDSEADLTKVLGALVTDQAVPYLAAHRYKPAGLEKFRTWQQVWDLQRREDAGDKVDIPVPPKYTTTDFRKTEFWKARGKLDVPKERFILYPSLGREGDTSLVLGWAGWDHKDQALALARELPVQDALGAGNDLLTQMVAGLVELEPWLHQWHSEMDVSFGVSPADAITGVIDQQLGRLETTREEVTAWQPPVPARGRRAKK